MDDVDDFYRVCVQAGLPESPKGFPRLHPPRLEDSGLRIGALLDPDGTLLRLIGNTSSSRPLMPRFARSPR
jgi:hypothetical protein